MVRWSFEGGVSCTARAGGNGCTARFRVGAGDERGVSQICGDGHAAGFKEIARPRLGVRVREESS